MEKLLALYISLKGILRQWGSLTCGDFSGHSFGLELGCNAVKPMWLAAKSHTLSQAAIISLWALIFSWKVSSSDSSMSRMYELSGY